MSDELMSDPTREVLGLDPVGNTEGDAEPGGLDAMTKAELIDHAEAVGIQIDDSMTKAEIREALG